MQTHSLPEMPEKKRRLVEAAVASIYRQGYAATTVDGVCADAGVTKGSFFHYFASKDEICRAAMEAWAGWWRDILAAARFEEIPDPVARIDRLFETMENTYVSRGVGGGCVIGNVAQELAVSRGEMREACDLYFRRWAGIVERLLTDVKAARPSADFDPKEVAQFVLSLVQGTFLVTKTFADPGVVTANLRHTRTYLTYLFGPNP